jgi:integrase/recombinase XerD
MGSCLKDRPGVALAVHAEGLRRALRDLGYAATTVEIHLRRLSALDGWLADEHIGPDELTEPVLARFIASGRAGGGKLPVSLRGLGPVLGFLRGAGVIPPAPAVAASPIEVAVDAYRAYLVSERRLAGSTVVGRSEVVARFLTQRCSGGGELDLAAITVADVHGFLFGQAGRLSVGSTRMVAEALRCFLRFLFATGVTPRELSGSVPGVAGHRHERLPRALDAVTVTALLTSCDRSSPVGLRDFAILTLMLRLGLRANEIATLRLADIDWRAGQIAVHGKGGRRDQLPLPEDVGQALVAYLRHGRAVCTSRAVFLQVRPPVGALSRNGVVMVPRTAARRAGIAVVGAHRLRHTAATEMLCAGASLGEVAQVLRHHSEQTTSIYAAVDLARLDQVVRPWPGAAR